MRLVATHSLVRTALLIFFPAATRAGVVAPNLGAIANDGFLNGVIVVMLLTRFVRMRFSIYEIPSPILTLFKFRYFVVVDGVTVFLIGRREFHDSGGVGWAPVFHVFDFKT